MDPGLAGVSRGVFTNAVLAYLVAGLLLFSAFVVLLLSLRRKPKSSQELEALRRKWLSATGKLGGGEIVELQDDQVSYVYGVRGITYNAWQDVSSLHAHLPSDRWPAVGGVGVKYDPRNPANSIIASETWTGLGRFATLDEKGAASLPRDQRPQRL